jgi:hypothetical protein
MEVKEIARRGGGSRKGRVGMMIDKRKGREGKRGKEVDEVMGRGEGK